MAATYYTLSLSILVLVSCLDGVRPDGRAINGQVVGIRSRPLMRNDRPGAIYLQRPPPPIATQQRRSPYQPPPPPPPPRQQPPPHRQLKGFFRNAYTMQKHHPPRGPAPVPLHNNHVHAFAGGNPGRGKFHPNIQQQQQQQQQHHLNHHLKPMMPIQRPHNQPPQEHRQQISRQPKPVSVLSTTTTTTTTTVRPPTPTQPTVSTVHNPPLLDPANLLKFQPVGDDYLAYLYLEPSNNHLDYAYLAAAANSGDRMRKRPQDDDDDDDEDVIIGAPTMNFDPYLTRVHSYKPTEPVPQQQQKKQDEPFRPLIQPQKEMKDSDDLIASLDEDWVPIQSPWDKYQTTLEPPTETPCSNDVDSGPTC